MRLLNTILDIIFPVRCVGCGESGVDLCLKCLSEFPPAERESANWIFPVYDYRHPPMKKVLWLFKYKNKKRLSMLFAEILYGKMLEEISELSIMENFNDPILIPVPLSTSRQKERGYNQTEIICNELIKIDNGENFELKTDILIKPKDTKRQAHIENRTERLKNIVGSFSVKNAEKIKDRNVILIDDITTTGATFDEAKKVLQKFGARKVIAFAVAH